MEKGENGLPCLETSIHIFTLLHDRTFMERVVIWFTQLHRKSLSKRSDSLNDVATPWDQAYDSHEVHKSTRRLVSSNCGTPHPSQGPRGPDGPSKGFLSSLTWKAFWVDSKRQGLGAIPPATGNAIDNQVSFFHIWDYSLLCKHRFYITLWQNRN